MAMIIVSKTSPISNLAQVGRLEILQPIYGKIIIPTAVYNELTAEGAGDIVLFTKLTCFPKTTCHRNW